MLEEIYNKTNIDMTAFIKRLEIELSINGIKDEEKKKIASAQLVCSIYDTMIIILGKTHQEKILNELYTTWLRMTKDYWYLNKYDKLFVKNIDINSDENSNLKIKSIQVGDTTTTFADTSSQIEINGTTYNTGTVDFDEDILVEKYKKALYENRRMRW
jgi:hypothetical protein|nr:MAG TPA: hypothetical protein [Caudoviricetes sp.]